MFNDQKNPIRMGSAFGFTSAHKLKCSKFSNLANWTYRYSLVHKYLHEFNLCLLREKQNFLYVHEDDSNDYLQNFAKLTY